MDIRKQPPSWQPDAKPSQYGWHHPITNELLVSVPGGVEIEIKAEEPQPDINPVQELQEQKQEEQQKIAAAVTQENVQEAAKDGLIGKLKKAVSRGKRSK